MSEFTTWLSSRAVFRTPSLIAAKFTSSKVQDNLISWELLSIYWGPPLYIIHNHISKKKNKHVKILASSLYLGKNHEVQYKVIILNLYHKCQVISYSSINLIKISQYFTCNKYYGENIMQEQFYSVSLVKDFLTQSKMYVHLVSLALMCTPT
jgi:hypothetical protein